MNCNRCNEVNRAGNVQDKIWYNAVLWSVQCPTFHLLSILLYLILVHTKKRLVQTWFCLGHRGESNWLYPIRNDFPGLFCTDKRKLGSFNGCINFCFPRDSINDGPSWWLYVVFGRLTVSQWKGWDWQSSFTSIILWEGSHPVLWKKPPPMQFYKYKKFQEYCCLVCTSIMHLQNWATFLQ